MNFINWAGQEVTMIGRASSFVCKVVGEYNQRLASDLRSHILAVTNEGEAIFDQGNCIDLVRTLMQLCDADENSSVRTNFISQQNCSYQEEAMTSFEMKICPALKRYHDAMVNAVIPFGHVVSFEKDYEKTSAYAFEKNLRALFSTKVFYSTLRDLPLNADIPCLHPDAAINDHIALQFFSRIMRKNADDNSIADELRRCFNVSSVDELEKMTKDQCLSILRGAKSANFQKTDYYRQTILVYLQEKVIFTNNDWSKKKITIYADSSHTKESCETMAAFIFRLDPAKKGFVRREEGIDHLSQVWGNKWIFPIA